MPKETESLTPEFSEPNREQEESRRYDYFINSYHKVTQKMKALQRRYPIPNDPEINEQIVTLDKERHDIHLHLLEMGEKLGKDKSDVLVDLIREQRTLEEYQLPEFSILAENDIITKKNDPFQPYEFNVDLQETLPCTNRNLLKTLSDNTPALYGESVIPKDKFMLVFAIVPVFKWEKRQEFTPDDFEIRIKRAEKLANELGGEFFNELDTTHHGSAARIIGVIFPNKDLENIVAIIRSNPKKFRLGEEFYLKRELKQIKKARSDKK